MAGPYPWACFQHRGASSPLPAYHRHNEVELTFLDGGPMVYELDGRRVEIPNRRLCLFWGGIPHRCASWGGRGELRVICLPMPHLLQSRLPRSFLKGLLSGELYAESGSGHSARDEWLVQSWQRDIRSRDPALLAIVADEIEVRLRRLALAETVGDAKIERGGDALSRLLGVMCGHATDSLTVTGMARMAGLHPKYAFRLFKRSFGITALEFLHRLRVSHAQRLLATTNGRVADVAFESGFGSASQFYEAFRRICGERPGDFRRRAFSAPARRR